MPAAEVDVTDDLVRALLANQHPDLAALPLVELERVEALRGASELDADAVLEHCTSPWSISCTRRTTR